MSDKDLASLCPSAKIYAAPEKRVVLSLNINGPKILVPCLSSGLGNGAHSMTVLNLGKLSIKTTRADLTIGLKWRSVGTCRPQTGMECKNTKLSQALLKKTQFIAFEFEEFGICEKLQYNSYVKVGDTYFLPAGISGDRYLVHLSKVNVHMCNHRRRWRPFGQRVGGRAIQALTASCHNSARVGQTLPGKMIPWLRGCLLLLR